MAHEPLPKEAIFIRWGRFQMVMSGRAAMLAVVGLAGIMLLGRALHLW